jgi:C-terminal processing protease CtpA/Prc
MVSAQTQATQLTGKIKKQVIECIAEKLNTNYVYRDTALKMGSFIRQQFSKGVYDTIRTPSIFAAQLTKDLLSVYHDGHLSVEYAPGFAESTDIKNPEAEKKQLDRFSKFKKRVNFGFDKAEILPGNIGYLKIGGFFAPDDESKAMAMAALRFISNSRALIIDLRNNMGGDPGMVTYICSFFFKARTHLNDLYTQKNKSTISYWTTPDSSLTALNTIPIYILTSKTTFSAGEELTYDLQSQKRAIIIGETTGGGAHPVQPFATRNGFVANIPFARAINPITKTNWETIGVKPDLIASADAALEAAINNIKSTPPDSTRQLRLQK